MASPTGADRAYLRSQRVGALFASIWLFFLLQPLSTAIDKRHTVAGVLGGIVTVVFAAAYMAIWLHGRHGRYERLRRSLSPSAATAWFTVLITMGVVMVVTLGQPGTAAFVYCAVAAVMLFALRVSAPIVLGLAAVDLLLGATVKDWSNEIGTAFAIVAASLAVWGIGQMMARQQDLLLAHEENADLAVENERTRFARDLHDILGHSLTVITVKAELAQRLIDVDLERTRSELADLERLSRDALADVRRAVEGYRELTLPGELARARTALQAAEIEAEIPNSTDQVPSDLRELFAWVVREGVTNVLRHSGAQRCSVLLGDNAVEVRDDGTGPGGASLGSGLLGLQERASAVGGTVVTRALDPGYSLRVVVS